ncbi:extracellular solute-binding protein [Haloarcula hispanica]|uniref:Extracellular solute-binding protein n=1 Tax=Haloarcula hispanica TaxID=51589 RepID=A0A5J5LEQ0_HALHI|nr:extracellular solute-binding protein [Haloarcula hispanica]KAA9404722.1 extracellular solute-binding protein [Haloarcula hispanica]
MTRNSTTSQGEAQQTRRRFITAAGAAGATAFAGCIGDSSGGSGTQTITLAVSSGDGELIKRLLKNHVESEVGVTTETTILPNANLFEKLSTMFQSEKATYDIVAMDDPWMPQFARHLAPIRDHVDSLPTDQIIQQTLDIGTWPTPGEAVPPNAQDAEPELKALCAVGNSHIFVVNERLYSEVGEDLPETWEDVFRAGQKISEQVDGAEGYAMRGKSGNPIMSSYFSVGMSMAGNMFDENWGYDWADDSGVEAASFFVNDLGSISPDGVASFDNSQVLSGLADGSIAAAPQWPSGTSLLLNEDKATEYENITFLPIPEGEKRAAPVQGNWLLGINSYADAETKNAAGDVLQSFVSKQAQEQYVDLGGVPFRHDTFEENMDAQPWFEALYGSLQNAKPRPRTPLWSEIETAQGQPLNAALVDNMSVEEAMTEAESQIESILDENGY